MRSVLQHSLESEGATITAEIMPPRGGNPSAAIAKAEKQAKHVHAFNVTDGSRAVMRMSSLALSKLLLEAGLDPVLQVACRDRNRIALQADLLGAHALGHTGSVLTETEETKSAESKVNLIEVTNTAVE